MAGGETAPVKAGPFEEQWLCQAFATLEYEGPIVVSRCYGSEAEMMSEEPISSGVDLLPSFKPYELYTNGVPVWYVNTPNPYPDYKYNYGP